MNDRLPPEHPSPQPLAPVLCPRCSRESTPAPLYPSHRGIVALPIWCVLGPFGSPCGEQLLRSSEVAKPAAPRANLGKPLEAAIRAGCKAYRAQGRANVEKIRTLFARRAGGGFGRMSTGRCDFVGTVAGGRACEFEAKCTAATRWPIAMISEMQRKRLDQLEQLGGLAGVVVRVHAGTADEADFWLPWPAVVAHEAAGGARTLPAESLAAIGVRLATKARALLWLDGALASGGGAL